ncbi:MAG: hypothetical protein BWY66_01449 [bacterium ADurb.Bin374]|nr:MAG: hypothetical protein BWY66_01449 [bacterium ADurb.Bin374]
MIGMKRLEPGEADAEAEFLALGIEAFEALVDLHGDRNVERRGIGRLGSHVLERHQRAFAVDHTLAGTADDAERCALFVGRDPGRFDGGLKIEFLEARDE